MNEKLTEQSINEDQKAEKMIAKAQEAFDCGDYKSLDEAILELGEEFGVEMEEPKIEILGKEFPVFSLEIGKTKVQIESDLKESGFEVTENAKKMIDEIKFPITENRRKIDLVRLKVADLGYDRGDSDTIDGIYRRAEAWGLELCPSESVPLIFLQLIKQKNPKSCFVGTEEFFDAYGGFRIFVIAENQEKFSLGAHFIDDWDEFPFFDEFIFCVPKKN